MSLVGSDSVRKTPLSPGCPMCTTKKCRHLPPTATICVQKYLHSTQYNSRLVMRLCCYNWTLVLLSSLPAVAVGFSPFLPPIARGRGLWKKLGPRSSKIEAESKLGVVSRGDSGITCDLRGPGGTGERLPERDRRHHGVGWSRVSVRPRHPPDVGGGASIVS
jgi:hypothetical protein